MTTGGRGTSSTKKSDPVDDYDISCSTKRSYPSKAQAKKKLKELTRKGDRHLAIYECRYCPGFHIGHLPGYQTYRRPGRPFG